MADKILYLMRIIIIIMLNLCIISAAAYISTQSTETLSKFGSKGTEVTQIQQKLQAQGLYKDKIDGIYGKNTENAVIAFQRAKKLTIDGIAGPKTLAALGVKAAASNPAQPSNNDYLLLARIISAESRSEPYEGQVAVGAVILNRVDHPSFPDTIAGVIYQPGAFSCVTDGQINEPVAESANRAAKQVLSGQDPSGGAIYYYNPEKTSNKFMLARPVIKTIGKHKFCK